MSGPGAINPVLLSFFTQPVQAVGLRPGEILHGLVEGTSEAPTVRFGSVVVPIEPIAGVTPGQAVSAEVVSTGQGLRLKLSASPAAPSPTPPPSKEIAALLTKILSTLGRLDSVQQAVHLVPDALPDNEAALKALLTVLLGRPDARQDIETIKRAVRDATDLDVLPRGQGEKSLALLARLVAPDTSDPSQHAQRLSRTFRVSAEARLAKAIETGSVHALSDQLDEDLAVHLLRLRREPEFARFLQQSAVLTEFDRALDRLLERLLGAQLQNLRGADAPYFFLDFPFPADSPLRHAQVHFFGGDGRKGHRFDPDNATVVLDLASAALGDLWITLALVHGICTCWIRATSIDVVKAIDDLGAELVEDLDRAGFRGARVHVTLWDGDRVQQVAALMRRFEGINLEA